MNEIVPLKAKYYELGRELDVPAHELEALRLKDGAVNFNQALNHMVLLWLGGRSTRTWQTLVRAVDSETGGSNHPLALEIAGRHRAVSSDSVSHPSSRAQLQCHPNIDKFVPCVLVRQQGTNSYHYIATRNELASLAHSLHLYLNTYHTSLTLYS